jgi:hypothetical protein
MKMVVELRKEQNIIISRWKLFEMLFLLTLLLFGFWRPWTRTMVCVCLSEKDFDLLFWGVFLRLNKERVKVKYKNDFEK